MASRGVVYYAYGEQVNGKPVEHWVARSMASLRRHHPELPVHMIKPQRAPQRPQGGDGVDWFMLADKARMFEESPYDETLYLDIDTVVLGDLSFAFAKAARHGIACAICECPWARRHGGLADAGDIVEYNSGVVFFARKAEPVFRRWRELSTTLDCSLQFVNPWGQVGRMPYADQGGFAKAIADLDFNPFVLPLNWNFRAPVTSEFFGPLKIWHSYEDVPPAVEQLNRYYAEPNPIIQMHRRR